jgi:hypothetical protein
MNLATIGANREQARVQFREYRKAVRERRAADRGDDADRRAREDVLLAKSYRELSLGKKVIDLHETLRAGGVDEKHRPRLAIVRADATYCWLRREGSGDCTFRGQESGCPKSRQVTVPRSVFGDTPMASGWRMAITGRALVPSIPPWARPKAKLLNYHILWEAHWTDVPIDPALLKHLGGPLYVVLAVWDLTELERSVLSLRQLT